MIDSATNRRQETRAEITRHAQLLADAHGVDGFTMDELAEAVGVSRRTLFNYVPGKIDAIIGSEPPAFADAIATFRAGGPTGTLLLDLRHVIAGLLRAQQTNQEEVARVRRLLLSDSRLVKAVHERLEEITALLADAIVQRENGALEPFTARVLAGMTLAIFDLAVGEFLGDSSNALVDHFLRVFDTATQLFS